MVYHNNSQNLRQIRLNLLYLIFWDRKFKCIGNIPIFFFILFDQIDAIFDLPMNKFIVRCIQISPKHIFFVKHQFKKLSKKLVFSCIYLIDGSIYFFSVLGLIFKRVQIFLEFFLHFFPIFC